MKGGGITDESRRVTHSFSQCTFQPKPMMCHSLRSELYLVNKPGKASVLTELIFW